MSDPSRTTKTQRSLAEQHAYLEAQEARIRARKAANISKQKEHATARVRRIGAKVLSAVENGDAQYNALVAEVDADLDRDAQSRKHATHNKKTARAS